MCSAKVSRELSFSNDLLFIDGSWGTGKSILGPVLGCYKGVEKQKLDHIFEYICTIFDLGEMEKGAAQAILKTYSDIDIFDALISREVNLRPSDDTGLLNNPYSLKYLKRLFKPGDHSVSNYIENENPALQIMSHHILPVGKILFETYPGRIKVIEMVRHPLFMLDHWFHYIDRCATDVREFTLYIKHKDKHVPWFCKGWEDEFLSLRGYNKVVKCIDSIFQKIYSFTDSLPKEERDRILFIPFEKFVLEPTYFTEKLRFFLDRDVNNKLLTRVLKKQKCPRKSLMAGRGHKSYGFRRVSDDFQDKQYIKEKLLFLEKEMSPEYFKLLSKVSNEYEERFNLKGVGPF